MANLKIFVSSTCYDLSVVRSQLRNFLIGFGYEPVMSDFSDVLYDPRIHTHTSCIQEVDNCDMMILIIGSRFGGKSIPKAHDLIDFDYLKDLSLGQKILEEKDNISITQLEVMKAIEIGLPIFTFIDNRVYHDHLVYEKNKDNEELISKIFFPSIDKQETARYIFEFINFLRLRTENNSISNFSKMEEIETFLRKQWSGLLQRLLYEQKNKKLEEKRMDFLANEIADIKTAIMTSISREDLKLTARGAIKYRRLIDFIYSVKPEEHMENLMVNAPWEEFKDSYLQIESVFEPGEENEKMIPNRTTVIQMRNGKLFFVRLPYNVIAKEFPLQWNEFINLSVESKTAIVNAILDNTQMYPNIRLIRPIHKEHIILKENLSDTE